MNSKFALSLLVLSVLAACSDDKNSQNDNGKKEIPEVHVAVLEHRCEPMDLTVKSGKTRFIIENKSQNAVEWEIMQGIRIIDERENIPPGFKRKMTTFLDPGTYEITCGLLSNPRGKMVVELAEGAEQFRKPTALELAGALGEFKVYSMMETAALLADTKSLVAAIAAGDLAKAQSLYATTMQSYEHIEPFLKQFAEVDRKIAADESLFKEGGDNPDFKGFHKIEKILFEQKTTEGLVDIAQQLQADVEELNSIVGKAKTTSRQLINFIVALVRESQQSKVTGAKNPYSQSDLMGIQANIEGSKRLFDLTKLMLEKAGPELSKEIDASYLQVENLLSTFHRDGRMIAFNQLNDEEKTKLKDQIDELMKKLEKLPETLGVE